MKNLLLSEYEIEIIIKQRFPNAVITQQESGDFAISYKGWDNARIVAYMWSEGYELNHHFSDIQKIYNSLHENELIRIEYGYYTSEGNGYNDCPFVNFDLDFQDPLGIEVREVDEDNRGITQYRLLTQKEYKIYRDLEEEYNSLIRR